MDSRKHNDTCYLEDMQCMGVHSYYIQKCLQTVNNKKKDDDYFSAVVRRYLLPKLCFLSKVKTFFLISCIFRGVFQYGLLHVGHTLGGSSCLGTQA
jgi:hypothetical protein